MKPTPWQKVKGDQNLRLNYNLTENSLCFDVGGYHGNWAIEMLARYNCNIWIFEPIAEFLNHIANRFKKNPKIKVFDVGLSNKTEVTTIYKDNENSSPCKKVGNPETVHTKNFEYFIKTHPEVRHIDLMKINIEGGEYNLLNHIIDTGLIEMIDNLQIQFHKINKQSPLSRYKICEKLKKTHTRTWCYDWVWENWKRK